MISPGGSYFGVGMFSEVLPGGIIRCNGVTWWISDLTM